MNLYSWVLKSVLTEYSNECQGGISKTEASTVACSHEPYDMGATVGNITVWLPRRADNLYLTKPTERYNLRLTKAHCFMPPALLIPVTAQQLESEDTEGETGRPSGWTQVSATGKYMCRWRAALGHHPG